MSVFSSLFKTKKQNLTPSVSVPNADTAPNYNQLGTLARQRIQAGITGAETPGVGFGPDFVSKTTNPAIAQRNASFTNQEMPFLSSQLSARGVGRSGGAGLATDVVSKAYEQKNRDVDNIYADMYKLNEAQKKQDITQGINLGDQLDSQFLNQGNAQASASERLANTTATDAVRRETQDRTNATRLLAIGAAPFTGGSTLPSALSTGSSGIYDGDLSQYSGMSAQDLIRLLQNGSHSFNALGATV